MRNPTFYLDGDVRDADGMGVDAVWVDKASDEEDSGVRVCGWVGGCWVGVGWVWVGGWVGGCLYTHSSMHACAHTYTRT